MSSPSTIISEKSRKEGRTVSILSSVLQVTRWTLVIAFIGIGIGVVFGPEATLTLGKDPLDAEAQGRTAYFGVFYDETTSRGGFIAASIVAMIYTAFSFFAITQILKILGNVKSGNPFVFDNGTYLRRVGLSGALAQIAVYGVWIATGVLAMTKGISFTGMTVQLSPAPWIGVLIAYSLSTIFRQGAELKQEQDLTV